MLYVYTIFYESQQLTNFDSIIYLMNACVHVAYDTFIIRNPKMSIKLNISCVNNCTHFCRVHRYDQMAAAEVTTAPPAITPVVNDDNLTRSDINSNNNNCGLPGTRDGGTFLLASKPVQLRTTCPNTISKTSYFCLARARCNRI